MTDCIKNKGVMCFKEDCENCGWNPDIAKERKNKLPDNIKKMINPKAKRKTYWTYKSTYEK